MQTQDSQACILAIFAVAQAYTTPDKDPGGDLPAAYLSSDDAADVRSLSANTIRRRISGGTIPAYQCGRGTVRIRLEDLGGALKRIPTFDW